MTPLPLTPLPFTSLPFTSLPLMSLIRRADVLADGSSDNDIRRARRVGVLTAIIPGVYLREAPDLDPETRHRAALAAVLARLTGDPVVSHVSAALLHHLPVGFDELRPVHVIRSGPAKSRRGPGLRAHRTTLAADEVVVLGGLAVTSVVRTVLDCALVLPFDIAVGLTRAALRRGQVTPQALTAQLSRHARVPGVRAAAAVLGFVDGGTDLTR